MVNTIPNLFVVGAPRSGTTSMYLYLKQHPDIYLSVLKEPHYYSTDLMTQPHTIIDEKDYHGLFSHSDKKINGEASVWYLISQDAPRNILNQSPNAKIIIMLRRPWNQIKSLHSLYLRTKNEDINNLEEAVNLEQERSKHNKIPDSCYFIDGLQYKRNALYYSYVKHYMDLFGNNVKVIIFDDFIKEPKKLMLDIFDFIGVTPFSGIEYDHTDATNKVRNIALKQLRQQPKSVLTKFHRNYIDVHSTKVPSALSNEFEQYLKRYFHDDILSLQKLIDRDLTHLWYSNPS